MKVCPSCKVCNEIDRYVTNVNVHIQYYVGTVYHPDTAYRRGTALHFNTNDNSECVLICSKCGYHYNNKDINTIGKEMLDE